VAVILVKFKTKYSRKMTNPFLELSETLAEINRKLEALASEQTRQPDFIGIDQASRILNLSKSTIYKRTMTGKLPFYKHGKKLMFSGIELQNFIKKHKHQEPAIQGVMIERD
jgi:excisionase family DNA binding protein